MARVWDVPSDLPWGGGTTPLASGTVAFVSVLQSFCLATTGPPCLSQDCGLELNDEDGHRCYPLEDHLFCQPCHVKRLEKGSPAAALHQLHF